MRSSAVQPEKAYWKVMLLVASAGTGRVMSFNASQPLKVSLKLLALVYLSRLAMLVSALQPLKAL